MARRLLLLVAAVAALSGSAPAIAVVSITIVAIDRAGNRSLPAVRHFVVGGS